MLEARFDLRGHGTTVRTEVFAGLTTFVTMAYIVVLNPLILGGIDPASPSAKRDILGATLSVPQVAAVTALVAGVPQLAVSTSISDHERRGQALERAGAGRFLHHASATPADVRSALVELVADPEPVADPISEPVSEPVSVDEPLEAFLDESPASDDPEARDDAADAAAQLQADAMGPLAGGLGEMGGGLGLPGQ